MKTLLAVLTILLLAPFMLAGALFELARFGVHCGRDLAESMMLFAFEKKGGAK